jgi:hypothetical protein
VIITTYEASHYTVFLQPPVTSSPKSILLPSASCYPTPSAFVLPLIRPIMLTWQYCIILKRLLFKSTFTAQIVFDICPLRALVLTGKHVVPQSFVFTGKHVVTQSFGIHWRAISYNIAFSSYLPVWQRPGRSEHVLPIQTQSSFAGQSVCVVFLQ